MPYSSAHSSEIDMFVVFIIGIVLLLLLGLLSFLAARHMRESFVEKHAQAAIDQMHALNGTYRNSVGQKAPGWNTAVQRVKLRSKRQFDTYNARRNSPTTWHASIRLSFKSLCQYGAPMLWGGLTL